jgi:diguanylate cyclase (GGDEF)-like protein
LNGKDRAWTLGALLAVLVVVFGMTWVQRDLALEEFLASESRHHAALARAFVNSIWPAHREFLAARAGSLPRERIAAQPEIRRLDRELRALTAGLNVVKVKIYDAGGLTVYSSEPAQIGENKYSSPGLAAAIAGQPGAEFLYRERFQAWDGEIAERSLVSSYLPIGGAVDGEVEAILEVYADVTDHVAELTRTQSRVLLLGLAASVLLYLFALAVGQRYHRVLARQEALRRLDEDRIRHQAYHDALTGLPNRRSFAEHLQASVLRCERAGWTLALLFLDLDGFKTVNDSLGHEAGDALLRECALRLRDIVRKSDSVYRVGGDEFTAVLENVRGPEEAAAVAQRILRGLAEPMTVAGQEVHAAASIGIALYPRDESDADRLLRNADAAMYHAKSLGRGRFSFYAPDMNARIEQRLALEAGLRSALREGQYELHYQPRIDARSGGAAGVEALLRWKRPGKGLVPPMEFIPLLEETGLIVPVGAWVIKAACSQNKAWQAAGLAPMRVSVNLSTRQFQSEDLLPVVREALAESGLEPRWLELELTESLLMADVEKALTTMQALKALGVGLSIDDFGTGYSSLGYLKRFPIDSLKIDRSFVRDLDKSPKDAAIVEAITELARSLGVGVVAEGIEAPSQVDFLRRHHCTELQGFYFSRPVAAAQVPEVLRAIAGGTPRELQRAA